MGFSKWASNEPDGSGNCARLTNAGWRDMDCFKVYYYICKKPGECRKAEMRD